MINSTERAADQAIFQLQLNTAEAVRYVMRNARVSEQLAAQAVKKATRFHKN